VHRGPLVGRRPAQDVTGDPLAVARVANAETEPDKVAAAEAGDDVSQSVVAAMTAADLDPHFTSGQVEVVVNNQD